MRHEEETEKFCLGKDILGSGHRVVGLLSNEELDVFESEQVLMLSVLNLQYSPGHRRNNKAT